MALIPLLPSPRHTVTPAVTRCGMPPHSATLAAPALLRWRLRHRPRTDAPFTSLSLLACTNNTLPPRAANALPRGLREDTLPNRPALPRELLTFAAPRTWNEGQALKQKPGARSGSSAQAGKRGLDERGAAGPAPLPQRARCRAFAPPGAT